MKRATRRKLETMVVPFVLSTTVSIVAAVVSTPSDDLPRHPSVPVAQVYVVGGVLLLALVLHNVWRSDEMERHLFYIGTSTAFVGTAVVGLVYGLMQRMGWPDLNWAIVYLVLVGFYCVGVWGAMLLRYR